MTVVGNGVYYGTATGRNAPHRGGKFPAIVMSHGTGGYAGQFGWIVSQLAEGGFVMLLPNNLGTTTVHASAVLNEITGNGAEHPFIDTTRIVTLGLSAGGFTALATAGARVDPIRILQICDETDHGMSDFTSLAQHWLI